MCNAIEYRKYILEIYISFIKRCNNNTPKATAYAQSLLNTICNTCTCSKCEKVNFECPENKGICIICSFEDHLTK